MEVFTISHQGRYLVYFPFHRRVLLGNAALVDLVRQANVGDATALERLSELASDKMGSLLGVGGPQPPGGRRRRTQFLPTSVTLLLTEDCTMRCRYCYAAGGKSRRRMPWKVVTGVIDRLFDNARTLGCNQVAVTFHGGDMGAVWPLFVEAREYLRDKECSLGIRVATSVGTNGLLDKAQRCWLTSNIESATLSLDGPPKIQDLYRRTPDGQPTSNVVMETVAHFDAVEFSYGIRSTITAATVASMEHIARYLCSNTRARNIQMEPVYPHGRAGGGEVVAPGAEEFVENFRKAQRVASSCGRKLIYSGARLDVLTDVFCKACGDSCVVTPLGELTSCYEVANAEDPRAETFFFGRYDEATHNLVVDEARRENLFALAVTGRPQCQDCFCKWHCAGDCPAKVLMAEGAGPNEVLDRCTVNRELTKDQLLASLASSALATPPAQ